MYNFQEKILGHLATWKLNFKNSNYSDICVSTIVQRKLVGHLVTCNLEMELQTCLYFHIYLWGNMIPHIYNFLFLAYKTHDFIVGFHFLFPSICTFIKHDLAMSESVTF